MNVLLVTPFSMSSLGGVTTAVQMMAREFTLRGDRVSILHGGHCSDIAHVGQFDAVPVYSTYLRPPIVPEAIAKGLTGFVLKYPLVLLRLHRFIKRAGIDVVFIQYPLAGMTYFGVLRHIGRWKLVVTFQGNDAHDLDQRHWIEALLLRQLVASADTVVAVSDTLLKKVRKAFKGLPRRAVIIPNGASLPAEFPGESSLPITPARYLVSVGQLIDRKGQDVLIRALGILQRRAVSGDVVLVGEGPRRQRLIDLAVAEGVRERVHFVGDQPHDVVFALVARSICFVLASRAEGFPLAIVEAMATGRPVIATDVDGISEIVRNGITGLLVPAEDPEALAGAIERICNDDAGREQMGTGARELAAHQYTWRHIVDSYSTLLGYPARGASFNGALPDDGVGDRL